MKKIAVVTTTRAEYGLLRNLIDLISKDAELELQLIVSGTHLLDKYGHTIDEIIKDNYSISKTIDYILESSTPISISKSMGLAMIGFAEAFFELKPDMLIVLGDRYELISICSAAVNAHIPIAHISGGEITEGALDDIYRHCVTKMSTLHFPACEEYRHRIIQLGEDPSYVFNYGDIGVENIKKINYIPKNELTKNLEIDLNKKTILFTYHPLTFEIVNPDEQIIEITAALDYFKDWNIVITASNSDENGQRINEYLKAYVSNRKNCYYFESLGIVRYLSLMKYSTCVVGNSSSGIVEAPILGIPTVNIGSRQNGRLQANTIVNAKVDKKDIIEKINFICTKKYIDSIEKIYSPYKLDNTSVKIVEQIKNYFNEQSSLKKPFYDIKF